MRTVGASALAAIAAGNFTAGWAVRISTTSGSFRVWGGDGTITLNGETYTGVGDRGGVTTTGGAVGGASPGLKLSLSGVEPDVLPLVTAGAVRDAAVEIWRLIFDGAGETLLDAQVWQRGRAQAPVKEEEPGGVAIISVEVETAARGLARRGGRMRTDPDQRLILNTDGAFKFVAIAAEVELAWGGKPPARAASALPGLTGPTTPGAGGPAGWTGGGFSSD